MLAPAPNIAPAAAPDPYTSNVMSYADKVRAALDQQSAPQDAGPVPTGPMPGAPPENPSQDNMTINARSGEFIFPEPVTKYYGVKKLEDMVQKALEDIKPPGQPAPPPMPQAQSFARGGLVGRKHFLRHVGAPHPARKVKPVKVSDIPLDSAPLQPLPSGPEPAGPMGPPPMAGPPMGTPMGPPIMPMRRPQGYAYGGEVKPYGGGVNYSLGGGYGGWGGGAPYGGGKPYGMGAYGGGNAYGGGSYGGYSGGPQPYIKPQWWGGPQPVRRITGYATGGEVKPYSQISDVPPFLAEPSPTPTPAPPVFPKGSDYHSDYQYNRLGDWRNIPYGSWYQDKEKNKRRLKMSQVPRGILS